MNILTVVIILKFFSETAKCTQHKLRDIKAVKSQSD